MNSLNKCLLIKMSSANDFGVSTLYIILADDYYLLYTSISYCQGPYCQNELIKGYYNNDSKLNSYCLEKIREYFENDDNTITVGFKGDGLYCYSYIDTDKVCFDYNFEEAMDKYGGKQYFYIDAIVKYLAYLLPSDILPKWLNENVKKYLPLKETLENEMNNEKVIKDYSLNKKVLLGLYPQSLVKDEKLISELDSFSENIDWRKIEKLDPFIKDFEYNGKKYRALKYETKQFENNNENNINEASFIINGYEIEKVYYFEYNPIVWSVFKKDNKYVLISDLVLDAINYDSLDRYLNDEFKNMSLENKEINAQIMTVEEVNEFLSKKELRKHVSTEYAMADGFTLYWDRNSWEHPFVWLKDFAENNSNTNRKCSLAVDGSLIIGMMRNYGYVSLTTGGIRPIAYLDDINELINKQDQFAINEYLNSVINIDSSFRNKVIMNDIYGRIEECESHQSDRFIYHSPINANECEVKENLKDKEGDKNNPFADDNENGDDDFPF